MTSPHVAAAGLATCAFVCGVFPAPASSDILVLDSTVPALKRGDRIADHQRIEIPPGRKIRILRPGGQTQEIFGAYKAKVADITRGEAVNEGKWKAFIDQIAAELKGGKNVGATRGVSR